MIAKMVEVGLSAGEGPQYFIADPAFEPRKMLLGQYTESEVDALLFAQARDETWALKIVEALNRA